jgi:hypothetical protein
MGHVRRLSPKPFGGLRFQSLLGRPEPTLFMESLHSLKSGRVASTLASAVVGDRIFYQSFKDLLIHIRKLLDVEASLSCPVLS